MTEETPKLYSISGFILEYKPTPFSGFFFPDSPNPQGIIGDEYGISTISDLRFHEDKGELEFIKEYKERERKIRYSLKKDGDLWIGSYKGNLELCGGVIAKVDYSEFPLNKMREVQQRERGLEKLTGALISGLVDRGVLREETVSPEQHGLYEEVVKENFQPSSGMNDDLPF